MKGLISTAAGKPGTSLAVRNSARNRQKRINEITPTVVPSRMPLSRMSASGGQILNQLRDYVQRQMFYEVMRGVQALSAGGASTTRAATTD
jgi:hypothetical protein